MTPQTDILMRIAYDVSTLKLNRSIFLGDGVLARGLINTQISSENRVNKEYGVPVVLFIPRAALPTE